MSATENATVTSPITLTPADLESIVDALSIKLRKFYILGEDLANQIINVLTTHLKDGTYTPLLSTPTLLAESLTNDLRSINNDKHLSVSFSENVVEEEEDPALQKHDEEDEKEQDTPMYRMYKEFFALNGNGFKEVKRLPGNVGYMKVHGFPSKIVAEPVLAAAFKLIENTQVLIIDVRDAIGGDGMTSDLLISHLVDEEIDLCSIYWRPQDQTMTTKTMPEKIKGSKYVNKPVYVLTNDQTFSACEKFAVCIQAINRAKIVGTTTAGGGHPCTFVRAGHDHFRASISIGKTTCLATGKGWEGVGCIPDIAVSGDIDPLHVAHLDAARMVMSAVEEEAKEGALSMGKKRLLDEIKKTVEELEGKVMEKEKEVVVPAVVDDKQYGPGVHYYMEGGKHMKRVVKEYNIFGFKPKFHFVTEAESGKLQRISLGPETTEEEKKKVTEE